MSDYADNVRFLYLTGKIAVATAAIFGIISFIILFRTGQGVSSLDLLIGCAPIGVMFFVETIRGAFRGNMTLNPWVVAAMLGASMSAPMLHTAQQTLFAEFGIDAILAFGFIGAGSQVLYAIHINHRAMKRELAGILQNQN